MRGPVHVPRRSLRLASASRGSAIVLALLLAGCSASASSSPTQIPRPSPSPSTRPSATAESTPSEEQGDPTPPPGSEALALVACPLPRTTTPACLDGATSGLAPAGTAALKVGQTATIVATVRNSGSTTSPPVTMLFFTFESGIESFMKVTACNGCQLHPTGAEWPGLAPGDHQLDVTLTATGAPTDGRDAIGAYQWLCAFFAEPFAQAGSGTIYTSASFALTTGATVINPK